MFDPAYRDLKEEAEHIVNTEGGLFHGILGDDTGVAHGDYARGETRGAGGELAAKLARRLGSEPPLPSISVPVRRSVDEGAAAAAATAAAAAAPDSSSSSASSSGEDSSSSSSSSDSDDDEVARREEEARQQLAAAEAARVVAAREAAAEKAAEKARRERAKAEKAAAKRAEEEKAARRAAEEAAAAAAALDKADAEARAMADAKAMLAEKEAWQREQDALAAAQRAREAREEERAAGVELASASMARRSSVVAASPPGILRRQRSAVGEGDDGNDSGSERAAPLRRTTTYKRAARGATTAARAAGRGVRKMGSRIGETMHGLGRGSEAILVNKRDVDVDEEVLFFEGEGRGFFWSRSRYFISSKRVISDDLSCCGMFRSQRSVEMRLVNNVALTQNCRQQHKGWGKIHFYGIDPIFGDGGITAYIENAEEVFYRIVQYLTSDYFVESIEHSDKYNNEVLNCKPGQFHPLIRMKMELMEDDEIVAVKRPESGVVSAAVPQSALTPPPQKNGSKHRDVTAEGMHTTSRHHRHHHHSRRAKVRRRLARERWTKVRKHFKINMFNWRSLLQSLNRWTFLVRHDDHRPLAGHKILYAGRSYVCWKDSICSNLFYPRDFILTDRALYLSKWSRVLCCCFCCYCLPGCGLGHSIIYVPVKKLFQVDTSQNCCQYCGCCCCGKCDGQGTVNFWSASRFPQVGIMVDDPEEVAAAARPVIHQADVTNTIWNERKHRNMFAAVM